MNKLGIVLNNFIDNLSLVGYEIRDRKLLIDDLLALINKHDKGSTEEASVDSSDNQARAEELYELGSNYYYGRNGCFEDNDKALGYYKQALDLGLYKASYNLGRIYEDKEQIPKAISTLMLGAENGCFSNYAELGRIYSLEEKYINQHNAELAWANFFENITDVIRKEMALGSKVYMFYFYLFGTLRRKWDVELSYLVYMSPYKEVLVEIFEKNDEIFKVSELGKELEFYIKYMIK